MERVELDKSFAVFSDTSHPGDRGNVDAEQTENLIHESGRLQLNTYQAFVQNLMNPRSDRRSLLLVHMTGTGKTITALATATEYVRQHTSDSVGSVIVLGFTKDIFRRELLAHPEFKFVSADEASEFKQLEQGMHASDAVAEQYILRKQRYHRRLINRNVHGIYQFYGYKQFANKVINMADVQQMVSSDGEISISDISAELMRSWIDAGNVRLNTLFIRSLERSLFICDEVHNLYKNGMLNTYGIAIKCALDYFSDATKPETVGSVRSLLLSATPLTSSALDVIPIVDLLTGTTLAHQDLFKSIGGVDQLTAAGIAKLRQLLAGNVSYIMDDNPREYPSATFLGTSVAGIDYLRFVITQPIAFQKKFLSTTTQPMLDRSDERGLNMGKDIVLPASPEAPTGTIFSRHIAALADAPGDSQVQRLHNGQMRARLFKLPLLKNYSCKYAELVRLCQSLRAPDHGKMFVYHPFVQGSGTDMIASILIANGFVFFGDQPDADSICMRCDLLYGAHARATHAFTPVCFTYINGLLSKPTIVRRLSQYNQDDNLRGETIKILLGSRAMRESHTLKACRQIIICHEPSSISELIQIIGRAVRKHVHNMLPAAERTVSIRILATKIDAKDSVLSELESYRTKVLQYMQVSIVDRIMYDTAIDYLINFRFKTRETPPLLGPAYEPDQAAYAKYLKELTRAYSDARSGVSMHGIHTSRFNVFYLESEARLVTMIIKRVLLDFQPLLTIAQMCEYVRDPPFHIEYNTRLISDEAIAMSLQMIIFTKDQLRIIDNSGQTPFVSALFDQSSSITSHDGRECRVVCVGDPLCADSYLVIRSNAMIEAGDNSLIDAYRTQSAPLPSDPIDLKQLHERWMMSATIEDILSEVSHALERGTPVPSAVARLGTNSHCLLVEWAIAQAVDMAIGKRQIQNLGMVRNLLDYYVNTKLVFTVADLYTTRVYDRYKKYNIDTGSGWWSRAAKPSTASLPICHAIGSSIRIYQPVERAWLDLPSIGYGVQPNRKFDWYLYNERIDATMEVALKIKLLKQPRSRGITLTFLQFSELVAIAHRLKVQPIDGEMKIELARRVETAALLLQKKIFPERIIYSILDM